MTTTEHSDYFNLHITGIGYLNDVRWVTPAKGDPYLACRITALNGPVTKPEYRYFDARVSGQKAQDLIHNYKAAVEEKKKVLMGFRLGDLWTDIFTYSKGPRTGQQAVGLKARLLFINWVKIDGEMVYRAEPKAAPEAAHPTGTESDVSPDAAPALATA